MVYVGCHVSACSTPCHVPHYIADSHILDLPFAIALRVHPRRQPLRLDDYVALRHRRVPSPSSSTPDTVAFAQHDMRYNIYLTSGSRFESPAYNHAASGADKFLRTP